MIIHLFSGIVHNYEKKNEATLHIRENLQNTLLRLKKQYL